MNYVITIALVTIMNCFIWLLGSISGVLPCNALIHKFLTGTILFICSFPAVVIFLRLVSSDEVNSNILSSLFPVVIWILEILIIYLISKKE